MGTKSDCCVALLRGINVGGNKKIKMADLKNLLESAGFTEVQTYIQSGNVVFRGNEDTCNYADEISQLLLELYGFEVSVIVLRAAFIKEIFDNSPFEKSIIEASYFTLLHQQPDPDKASKLNTINLLDEQFHSTPFCVYFYAKKGYGRAKGTTNFFEKKLGVNATTRNYKTMLKLIKMSN